jgi:3' exoribonuclease, RNase T-like
MATNHIMVDLETLATTPNCVILTIGAVKFDPFDNYIKNNVSLADLDKFYARIDLDSQPNRHIDDGTVEWWSKQNQAAQNEAFNENDRIPLSEALDQLHKFIWQSSRTWCQGPSFDIPILEHAYREFGKPTPWNYSQTRDSRTVCDLVSVELPAELQTTTHNAAEDCYKQIIGVQLALSKLGVEKFVR